MHLGLAEAVLDELDAGLLVATIILVILSEYANEGLPLAAIIKHLRCELPSQTRLCLKNRYDSLSYTGDTADLSDASHYF